MSFGYDSHHMSRNRSFIYESKSERESESKSDLEALSLSESKSEPSKLNF